MIKNIRKWFRHTSSKELLLYFLILVLVVVGLIGFLHANRVNKKEKQLEAQEFQLRDSLEVYGRLHSVDSLLLRGDYREAIEDYKSLLADRFAVGFDVVGDHLKIARHLLEVSELKSDSLSGDSTVDTLIVDRQATPEEVRLYDSLTFALTKTRWQVENLRKQLTSSTQGQYLTFSSSKGTTVHYVGDVRNNQAHGKGVALLNSGSRYEGEWKKNQRDGYGTFYWADGEYYEGNYKNDKRHGQGTYYWTNGEKFIGQWENDQRNGRGIFHGEEGDVIAKGIWKNDELVEMDK